MRSNSTHLQKATFGGGCFWCTEAIFKRLKGVISVTSGYSGGDLENPSYEQVSSGGTSHAEAVQVEFNPRIISFEKLLEIFWATHDPTTLNRQGEDVGSQYRSVIFYHDEGQKQLALKSKEKMMGKFKDNIVTEIIPFKKFFKAEQYHQNYYDSNPQGSYCSLVITPKIQKLIKQFNQDIKEEYKK